MFGLEIAMLPIESEKFRDSLSPVTVSPEFWVWGQLQTLVLGICSVANRIREISKFSIFINIIIRSLDVEIVYKVCDLLYLHSLEISASSILGLGFP